MRIFMLTPHAGIRGPIPKHSPYLVQGLRELGCEVETEAWGRHADDQGLLARLLTRLKDVSRLSKRVAGGSYDVVVVKTAHDWPSLVRDIALARSLARSGTPVVLQLHGSHSALLGGPGHNAFRLASRFLVDKVDGLLVLSREEGRDWRAFAPKLGVFVVDNPLPTDLATTRRPAEDSTAVGDAPQLLYVGRVIKEKGVFDLVEALASVEVPRPPRLLVVGEGPALPDLSLSAERLGLGERVIFAGHLSGEELAAAYARSDVLVLPTYWAEGFPTVIGEAMRAGLPIVTTKIRGAADHLEEGVNALFVPPRDPQAVAAAIRRLLADSQLSRRMGEANRIQARDFDPVAVARRYLGALKGIVSGRSSSAASGSVMGAP